MRWGRDIPMMTLEQLTVLAESGESETLEFKTTTGVRREAARATCAFLNKRGGRVLLGVSPDGNVVGQQVSDRTIGELLIALLHKLITGEVRVGELEFPDVLEGVKFQ